MTIKVEIDDLEFVGFDGGGSEIFKYNGQPFNGMLVTKSKNNVVLSEEGFIDGYKEGTQRYYYPTGALAEEFYLKNNSLHGVYKEWDQSGNLTSVTTWQDGVEIS